MQQDFLMDVCTALPVYIPFDDLFDAFFFAAWNLV